MAKKPLIIANWKAHKTVEEALRWLKEFNWKLEIPRPEDLGRARSNALGTKVGNWKLDKVEIVICPPFTALQALKLEIGKLGIPRKSGSYEASNWEIKLGAQDLSPFDTGPYTGEVSARMLSELVDYVLVGHSERRRYFGETTEMIGQKVKIAQKAGIVPIVCAARLKEVPGGLNNYFLMFEPPEAISKEGVYRPKSPEDVGKTIAYWKSKLSGAGKFLYGGSVNSGNIAKFLSLPDIAGVVVGHASLEAGTFIDLLNNVPS